jgi:hypothetical protein
VAGAWPASKWISAGIRAGRAAEFFSTTARYAKTNRAAVALASQGGNYMLALMDLRSATESYYSTAGIHTALAQGTESVTPLDFVPVVASLRAFAHMRSECAGSW